MLVVLLIGFKTWNERRELSALISLVSGIVSAYLMNRERLRFEDGFIPVGLTGWFWLGLGSSIAIVVVAVARILRLQKPTRSG
jgi:hypothetical protein